MKLPEVCLAALFRNVLLRRCRCTKYAALLDAVTKQRLGPRFTLVFKAVREDLSSPVRRQEEYDRTAAQFARSVNAGAMTQAQCDQMLTGLKTEIRSPRPPQRSTITLSATDSALVIEEMQSWKRTVWLVQNGKTLRCDGPPDSSLAVGQLLETGHDLAVDDINIPVLGCSIPQFELFQRNQPASGEPGLVCPTVTLGGRRNGSAAVSTLPEFMPASSTTSRKSLASSFPRQVRSSKTGYSPITPCFGAYGCPTEL